ncbi:hypothetical protein J1N35_001183 [Gossypium stocksii]|uniref:Uncharacterized protein n=1 Tax=Gossypium stocksii TaxID=47602 RepID=A0A9D3WIL7_9ROSI|nr:hypothetical protein J1N35_001183 [Gossypium stocksii]
MRSFAFVELPKSSANYSAVNLRDMNAMSFELVSNLNLFCTTSGDSLTRIYTFSFDFSWLHPRKNYSKYSMFISVKDLKLGNIRIDKRLLQVSKYEELAIREDLMIPRMI